MKVSAKHFAALGAAAMALANVGRIPMGTLGGRTAPFVVDDVATVLLWGALAAVVFGRRVRVTLDDISLPAALFVLVAAVSTAMGIQRYGMGFWDAVGTVAFLVRWVVYFGWYLFVVWCLTPDEARSAWRYIETSILVVAAFGIVQSAFLPGFAQMIHAGSDLPVWDEQGHRLVSTVLDPNFAGLLIAIALIFRLARMAEGIQEPGNGWILTLLAAALVLTVSRSSVLALAVGLVVIVALRGVRFRLGYVFAVAAALAIPVFFLMRGYLVSLNRLYIDTSALERVIPWARALVLFRDHPVLGIGFNAAREAQRAYGWIPVGIADVSLDAGLLFVATMTGIIGLALYLAVLWRVVRVARLVYRDPAFAPADRAHGVATAACVVAVVVHSFFANSLLLPFVMQILWVMWGTLMQIAARRPRRLVSSATLAAIPLLVVLGACEPCAGTNVCSPAVRLDLMGQIVDAATGVPVPGASVQVELSDGESFHATTDGNGDWEVVGAISGKGPFTATAMVTAPGHAGYTVPSFPVAPVSRKGDATPLGTWVSYPHVRYQAGLMYNGKPLVHASVKFQPTAGVPVTGTLTGSTNGAGIFSLDVYGQQLGTVIGNLTVADAVLPQPTVLRGYTIPLDYRYGIPIP
ncbi:MAG TPA: O-antigen ligase family protein, partial [Gemmatimonadaceae bacterium]|nr:O-antigen ligase family protein [Gemmatimonadaceae bacterium]